MPDSDFQYLLSHRQVWAEKPVLRRLYEEQFYRPLLDARAPGSMTLEIGSGPGFMHEFDPTVFRSDILSSPWIRLTLNAQALPFAIGSLHNVIGLDVLHHLADPLAFLREAERVLHPGGRLLLIEPWLTPFSRFVYTFLHQERCDPSVVPWTPGGSDKEAFDGNAAIPFRLVTAGSQQVAEAVPQLRLKQAQPFSFLTYLLSLGFKRGNLLPASLYAPIYRLERWSEPAWRRAAALRVFLVWEKAP